MTLNGKKLFVVIPAYNAGKKILLVLKRIPKEIWARGATVLIVNDGSVDDTREKIAEIRSRWGNQIFVIDKKKNEGYARALKSGMTEAVRQGADFVAIVHADNQFTTEMLPELLQPLIDGSADIVQGSRTLNRKYALDGGMPKYKFVANIALSKLENLVFGLGFAEYHSGYLLYTRSALETIPFTKLSDTFHFDGEIILVGSKKGLRIKEIATPYVYADEVSNLKPIKYGFDVLKIMWRYLMGKYDF